MRRLAAHAALTAVDPELGVVEILDYVVVDDRGELVNPMIVDGQVYGGAAEAALRSGEILEAVRIPTISNNACWGFYKFCRKTGEFAQAIGVVLSDPDRGVFRAVIGATDSRPLVLEHAASLFDGRDSKPLPERFDRCATRQIMEENGLGDDAYFLQVHLVALERAARKL